MRGSDLRSWHSKRRNNEGGEGEATNPGTWRLARHYFGIEPSGMKKSDFQGAVEN
jgi:hypothetical protein